MSDQNYLRWVGDIEFDALKDDSNFNPCYDELDVKQYFNFSQGLKYSGEKKAIIDQFRSKYKPVKVDESGLIRIRFIVNCKGETGRFRLIGADKKYKSMDFDIGITDQLVKITKELRDWKILPNHDNPQDYYQYLSFKIENGNLIEVLP